MDKLLYRTLLLDFYGELLTEKQREVFGLHYLSDLSLNEIGEEFGVSRQAAWDLVHRTEKLMASYEEKLRLIEKHGLLSKRLSEAENAITSLNINDDEKNCLISILGEISVIL